MPTVPRKIKATAPAAGELEIDVPEEFVHKDDLKEQYVPKDHFQTELERRVTSLTKELKRPEDLIKDDGFMTQFAESRKDDLIKILGLTIPKPGEGPDLDKIRKDVAEQVRRDELTPVANQNKAFGEEVSLLRVRDLDAQVLNEAVVHRVVPDLVDLVKIFVNRKVDWDPERKQWFVKKADGSGFEFSADPKKGGHPYKGVRELMEELSRDPDKKSWFEVGTQAGVGYQGRGGGVGDAMTVDSYQKLSQVQKTQFAQEQPARFRELMNEIRTAGENKLFAQRR